MVKDQTLNGRTGSGWALAIYAIYWRYTRKRVPALLVIQKSQKEEVTQKNLVRRPKEGGFGTPRSAVGWEAGLVLGIVPPTGGLASWLGINKQLQLRRGGRRGPSNLQLPSRQSQTLTLQLHLLHLLVLLISRLFSLLLHLLHLLNPLLLLLLLLLQVLLTSGHFSTSAPKKGGVTM